MAFLFQAQFRIRRYTLLASHQGSPRLIVIIIGTMLSSFAAISLLLAAAMGTDMSDAKKGQFRKFI